MSIHRWKEDFLKKSNVPLELHKGMSKIIIIVCYSFIIPAISIKVILDLIPVSEDPPLPFCSTWIVKTQSDLQKQDMIITYPTLWQMNAGLPLYLNRDNYNLKG